MRTGAAALALLAGVFLFNTAGATAADSNNLTGESYFSISAEPAIDLFSLQKLVLQSQWVEPVFGPEFTFTLCSGPEPTWGDHYIMQKMVTNRCRSHLIDGQEGNSKFSEEAITQDNTSAKGTRFTSPNGWSFNVYPDPGVAEVTMAPMTVEGFERYKIDIQDAIFASAANEGLFPALYRGGGHISISWRTFANNLLLLRNFLADMYNHSELAMGILNYDTNNALPLSLANEKSQSDFRAIIYGIDSGALSSPEMVRTKLGELYWSDEFVPHWQGSLFPARGKHTAVNFSKLSYDIEKSGRFRIEIRSVRPQASIGIFIRQIRLFRNRLRFLQSLRAPIALGLKVRLEQKVVERHLLNPPLNPQEAMRAFYTYVAESGERWADQRDYIWPQWIENGEREKFEHSDWFLNQESSVDLPSSQRPLDSRYATVGIKNPKSPLLLTGPSCSALLNHREAIP